MPPTQPTAEQLANRLNPTPTTIYTPQEGLFRARGDYGTTIYKSNADGTLTTFNLLDYNKANNLGGMNAGQQADRALRDIQSKYGFSYEALPEVNMADLFSSWRGQTGKGYDTPEGWAISPNQIKSSTNIMDFVQGKSADLSSSTINTEKNALATPEQIAQQMKDPNWVGANTDPNRVINQTTGQTAAQMTPQAIQQGLTQTIQGYGPSSYTGGSIVDYLGSLGKPSDFNSRAALAKQFGITNYTGTAEQNTQLLGKLRSLGATPPPSGANPPSATGLTIGAQKPIQLGTIGGVGAGGTYSSQSVVAGAEATQKSIADYMKLLAGNPSETQKRYDAILAQIEGLLPSQGGRGAEQAAQEAKQGVDALKMALAQVNGKIGVKMAQYKALSTQEEGKPITMNSIIGAQAQIQKAMASDIGLLQAQALGLQGQLEAAQEAADRAVDLKFADAKDAIDLRMSQLQLLEGQLTKEEKIRADAINMYLQDKKDALAVQIANEKDKNSTLLNLLQKYPDAGISINDSLEAASAKVKNSRIYQQETRLAGGGTSGGGTGGPGGSLDQAILFATSGLSKDLRNNAINTYNTFVQRGDTAGAKAYIDKLLINQLPAGAKEDVNTMEALVPMIGKIQLYNLDQKLEGIGGLGYGSIASALDKAFGTSSAEARDVRQMIGNIAGTIAKLRGGTSFTPNEQALLETYTPTINENPAVALSKLNNLVDYINNKKNQVLYSGQASIYQGGSAPTTQSPGTNADDPLGLGL